MSKLIMLSGLPASGKTTRAIELVAQGNTIRLNKDDLRAMLHRGKKWSGKDEAITITIETVTARALLLKGHNVVIDDTNLSDYHLNTWKNIAHLADAKFVHEKIDTPWFECVIRDEGRSTPVGRSVIVNMALQYGRIERPNKGYILCDLDGTLCDIRHRLQYAQGETKNWTAFFSGISGDTIYDDVMTKLIGFFDQGYEIILVSARPDTYRQETTQWLADNDVPYLTLIMRKGGDKREDSVVKQQILDTYFPDRSVIYKVIDDRPRVIRMWRDNGLDVIDVGDGIDF